MIMETKKCTKCGVEKELSEFRYRKDRGVYESECIVCYKKRTKEYYKKNKEKVKFKVKEYREKNKDEIKKKNDRKRAITKNIKGCDIPLNKKQCSICLKLKDIGCFNKKKAVKKVLEQNVKNVLKYCM